MSTNLEKNCRQIMEILMGLAREIRCCSRDEAICRDVTFNQFVILDAVAREGELDLAQLHGILSVEKSTTTRLVNPLIKRGLLKRGRSERDSRAVRISLTEEGRTTHQSVWLCLTDFFQNITRQIPEARRNEVLDSVMVFTEAMKSAAVECRCCK